MKGQWGKLVGWFVGTLIVSAAVTFGPPLLGGGSWLPELISSQGAGVDRLFWGLMWMSVVIFAVVAVIVLYSITHFRAEPGDLSDGEHIHGNAKMETMWVVVPTIIVAVIALLSYQVLEKNEIGLFDQARASDQGSATMQVDVRGFQFAWAFRYRDRQGHPLNDAQPNQSSSELVLPVGETVRFNVMSCSGTERLGRIRRQVFRELDAHGQHNAFAKLPKGICEREWDLTTAKDRDQMDKDAHTLYEAKQRKQDGKDLSKEQQGLLDQQPKFNGDDQYIDVNHAFWVPEARLKVDAVSGLRTYVQWTPTRVTKPEDKYQVVCAELCGTGHNGMRTDMCVVSHDTFTWWVKLGATDQQATTCVALRLLTCFDSPKRPEDVMGSFRDLVKKRPDANCKDAREAVA